MISREKFEKAFDEWMEEAKDDSLLLESNSEHFYRLESFQKIIGLGKGSLPYIVEKLQAGHFMLNHAMKMITDINIIKLNKITDPTFSEQKISNLWIEWWKDNKKEYMVERSSDEIHIKMTWGNDHLKHLYNVSERLDCITAALYITPQKKLSDSSIFLTHDWNKEGSFFLSKYNARFEYIQMLLENRIIFQNEISKMQSLFSNKEYLEEAEKIMMSAFDRFLDKILTRDEFSIDYKTKMHTAINWRDHLSGSYLMATHM